MNRPWVWARYCPDGYEVSTVGDHRFSPITAVLPDGRTIEEAYQLDVKGYRSKGFDNWMLVKGRPPVVPTSEAELFKSFVGLWVQYLEANPLLVPELIDASSPSRILTDQFAKTNINQAAALAVLLNTYTFGV